MTLSVVTTIYPGGIYIGVKDTPGAPLVTKPSGSIVINSADNVIYESLGGGVWIALNSGALSPAWPPPNCYYIDANVTDNAASRCYSTIAAAVTAIEADTDTAGLTLTLYLASDGVQEFDWDGATSGLVAGSDRSYILQSLGQNEDAVVLNIQGAFVAATGAVRLQMNNLLINVDAGVDLGTGRQLVLHECDFYGNSTAVRSQGIVARDCNFTNHRFVAQAANASWVLYDCRETSITSQLATIWGGGVGFVKQGGATNIAEDNFIYFSSTGVGVAEVSGGASFRFNNTLNGASGIFNIGGGSLGLVGATFNCTSSGGGTNDLGNFTLLGTSIQVSFFGTDPTNIPAGAWHVNAGAVVPVP